MTATPLSGTTPRQTGGLNQLRRDCISVGTRVGESSHGNSRKPLCGGSSLGATVAEARGGVKSTRMSCLAGDERCGMTQGRPLQARAKGPSARLGCCRAGAESGAQALVKTMRRQTQIRYIYSKTICYLRSNIGPFTEMTRE